MSIKILPSVVLMLLAIAPFPSAVAAQQIKGARLE